MLGKGPMLGAGNGSDDTQKQSYPGKAAGPVIGKEKSKKTPEFAQGGDHKMFQGSDAAPQKPGQSASQFSGGPKHAEGGNGKMYHDGNGAAPQKSGQSASQCGSMGAKFAEGGSTKMFGPQQASPATAGASVK